MKKKILLIFGLLIAALTLTGVVQAFTMNSVDGVWGKIDTNGATGDTWATGPAATSIDYDNPTHTTNSTTGNEPFHTQNLVTFDWNQVRYGLTSTFGNKSGFGFLGRTGIGEAPTLLNTPFNVGTFCHFNNPITAFNDFEWVDLTATVSGLACDSPYALVGQTTMDFVYRFNLDETTNNQRPCEYGPGSTNWPTTGPDPNRNGCADRVNITKPGDTQYFTCVDNITTPGDPVEREYTVSLMGFIDMPASGQCPAAVPIGTDFSNNLVYTAEETNNCYCVYAAITKEDITPVVMLDFAAEGVSTGIQLTWITATEVNHLGFNVYRSEMEFGVKEKINSKIVVGDSNPGNPFGANYAYLDTTAEPGLTYFYWVEDVPSDTSYTPELFGPVSAARP